MILASATPHNGHRQSFWALLSLLDRVRFPSRELEPTDAYGYLNRARVYMSMDKTQQALADANKAIELEPNEPDAYFRRSDIYYDMGKDTEAKADEKKAEELDKKAR